MTISPTRTVYLNGTYLPETEAKVSVFDRGYLMADAVYEYTAVLDGRLVAFDAHMERLKRSLQALQMDLPLDREALLALHRELVARNDVDEGGIYLQISRGVAARDFAFPDGLTPTVLAFAQDLRFQDNPINNTGLRVVSVEDGRWARRDIKSVQLLYTAMAKTEAVQRGANDAFFVQDGLVTEATSSNAFIVRDGAVVTRQLSTDLLHGVTRAAILELCAVRGLRVEERAFSIAEAQGAEEVFVTASPFYALPVVEVDGVAVADGRPGALTRKLRARILARARDTAI